jgi:methyltransferase-like protein 6
VADRVNAFVCDITSDPIPDFIKESSVDCVTLIFVLSAMSMDKMKVAIPKIHKVSDILRISHQ